MKICICGGGSLGHVCAGVIASSGEHEVSLFTGHPDLWTDSLFVTDNSRNVYSARLAAVSNMPADVIPGQDIVFLCLPGFMIEKTLEDIRPYVGNAVVGSIVSSTGFFSFAHKVLGQDAALFGFQRTPFIARVDEYGKSARLLGYKPRVYIYAENVPDPDSFRSIVERMFITPTALLDNIYEASLTNSNPILHTGRLYSMFKEYETAEFDHNILFYKEWTDESSEMIITMDEEFGLLLKALGVDRERVPSLLDYYEAADARSLTEKISGIEAFQKITSPMKKVGKNKWTVDFSSRYFTEDFPFGLKLICDLAHTNRISVPTMDEVLQWGMNMIGHNNG
ncbi:MAG: NAD/NADP octopine/nopaline dehydrogenase family protein [Bacteroidales bacterium]|nr:NAD/NADP octopine/nopaline dehydrogenase family protein [Bacteroidales bacterium]